MQDPALDQLMKQAFGLHQAGQLAQAEKIYREVLSQNPNHFDALHMLGVVARQTGRIDAAGQLLHRAIAINPNVAEAHNNLANVYRQQKKLDDAVAHYRRAISIKPDWAEAYASLANAQRDQGNFDDAVANYTKAIQLQPTLVVAYINLGNVLCDQKKRENAIAIYKAAIGINPEVPEAHNHLGNALWDLKRIDEAYDAYAAAVSLRPSYPEANWSIGKILSARDRMDEALVCFQRAVDFNPHNALAHLNLGRMLMKMDRRDAALAEYREAIRLNPDSPDWKYELAAKAGDPSVRAAPSSYVKNLFDSYAPTFDKHLLENLAYQTPAKLLAVILKSTAAREFDVLDLGCGTGLCGKEIKSYARQLAGVDLSPAMIEVARTRGIYDELIVDELLPPLRARPGRYDLILAGDVLVYIGDLSELFPAVSASLRPGGIFAFSIESHDGEGYILHAMERFAHSISYIRELAAKTGLTEISAEKIPLRKHRDREISGWIVLLAKPI